MATLEMAQALATEDLPAGWVASYNVTKRYYEFMVEIEKLKETVIFLEQAIIDEN